MENNNKTKWLWAIVVVVVIVVLILIARKDNQEATVDVVNTTESSENRVKTAPKATGSTAPIGQVATPTKNVVQLTSTGFKPFLLEIKRGESVEFINASNDAMVIHSQTENTLNAYPGFSQESGPLGKGGKFYFAFTVAGAWPYYNLNSITGAKDQGVIIVK